MDMIIQLSIIVWNILVAIIGIIIIILLWIDAVRAYNEDKSLLNICDIQHTYPVISSPSSRRYNKSIK